jgi:hypothetical protein
MDSPGTDYKRLIRTGREHAGEGKAVLTMRWQEIVFGSLLMTVVTAHPLFLTSRQSDSTEISPAKLQLQGE